MVRMDVTLNERKAVLATRAIAGGFDKVAESEKKAAKESKALETQTKKLGREATKAWEKSKSGAQKYRDQIRMLDQAKKATILTEKQHAQAVRYTKQQFQAAGVAARLASRGVRTVGVANQAAFGPAALSSLMRYAAGYVGVSAAVRGVTMALREMSKVRQESAERQKESEIGLGSLGQLALGDPVKLRSLVSAAKQTYREGGAATLGEAGKMIFQLESAGALEDWKFFSDLRSRSLLEQPGKMGAATAALNKTMGEAETGGTRALVSKGFAASAYSPSSVEEIMAASATSGLTAGLMGMRDEPILAGTAVLATQKVDAATAGTWFSQMMTTWQEKPEIEGKTFEEALDVTQKIKESMTSEEFARWFGRKQGRLAFEGIMADRPRFEKALRDIDVAEQGSMAQKAIDAADTIPELVAVRSQRQAKAKKELGETELGIRRNLTDTMMDSMRTRGRDVARRSDYPRIVEGMNLVTDIGMRGIRALYGDDTMLRTFGGELPEGPLQTEANKALVRQDIRAGGEDPNSPIFAAMLDMLGNIDSKMGEANANNSRQPNYVPVESGVDTDANGIDK
jgi:hypothetical protein